MEARQKFDVKEFVNALAPREPMQSGNLPKVSIVMPSFNQEAFMERSILSVLNQNYPNLEFIIIDGGSTDGTTEVIKKYSSHIAYWVSRKDRGQSDALNRGFARVTGDILGWLNSDDLYLPGAVNEAVNTLQRNPQASVVFGDWLSIDSDDQVIAEHPAFDFNLRHFIYEGFTHNAQGMFWTRAAHARFGEFNVDLHRTMDYDLIVRLGMQEKFVRLPQALACFRRHEAQKTTGQDQTVIREHRAIADNLGFRDKFTLRGRLIRLLYRARRGYWYAKRRDFRYAWKQVSTSISNRASRRGTQSSSTPR